MKEPKHISELLSDTINSQIKRESSNSSSVEPFLRYIGAKFQIAPYIVPYFTKHKIYIEPFMGSASIFFYKPKSDSSVLNDINGHLVNLMVQIRDNLDIMTNWIWNTPFSEELHNKISNAFPSQERWNTVSKVKQAGGYFYLLQLAFNESVGNLASPAYKISKGKQKWNNDLCTLIYNCSRKLDNVMITNRNYRELIMDKAMNTKDSFWYLDPPYTMADDKNYYSHNFAPDSHRELYNAIKLIVGSWMISYDDSPMIREIYKELHIYKLKNFNNEIIITNYKIIKQEGIFGEDYLI